MALLKFVSWAQKAGPWHRQTVMKSSTTCLPCHPQLHPRRRLLFLRSAPLVVGSAADPSRGPFRSLRCSVRSPLALAARTDRFPLLALVNRSHHSVVPNPIRPPPPALLDFFRFVLIACCCIVQLTRACLPYQFRIHSSTFGIGSVGMARRLISPAAACRGCGFVRPGFLAAFSSFHVIPLPLSKLF